jgi:hypothetical protein
LCSQSPYVLHSILVISSPEMHGTFILNVAYLICEPNFASTQSRPPSGWNFINGVQVGGQALVVEQSQFEVFFSWVQRLHQFQMALQFTLSVESQANCSSLPNPNPTFPCSSLDFAFLVVMVEVLLWIHKLGAYHHWTIHFQYTILLLS